MSFGRQLTPGFPRHAAPVALPVKPAAGDKAYSLGEGFSSSQRKAFVLGSHPSPPLASSSVVLAQSLDVLDARILPSLFGSPVPGRFHQWLQRVGILRRAVAVLEDWIQALSRFLSRVAADVCV